MGGEPRGRVDWLLELVGVSVAVTGLHMLGFRPTDVHWAAWPRTIART